MFKMEYFRKICDTPVLRLKLIAIISLVLFCASMTYNWAPYGYPFYNTIFIITLFWTIHSPNSVDAVLMAILVAVVAIFFDICLLIGYYNKYYVTVAEVFAIINLLVRPVSLLGLYREFIDRDGLSVDSNGLPKTQQSFYEKNIVQPPPAQKLPV